MNRKKLQDVVPHRSIRDIPVPGKSSPRTSRDSVDHERELTLKRIAKNTEHQSIVEEIPDEDFDEYLREDTAQQNFAKWGFWFISVAAILFLIFSIILFLTGGKITITPKQNTFTISNEVSAQPDGAINATNLNYQVLTLSKEAQTTIPLGTSTVSTIDQKATGKITISNSFSSTDAVLIKNTRFQSQSGLIYRISEPVRVPGYTTKNGTIVPGTLDVTVFADEYGSKYNTNSGSFTIPGFKNDTARYSKITAQLKTPITGGIAKNELDISLTAKEIALEQLHNEIKESLLKDIHKEKPADSVLYENAYKIVYTPETQTKTDNNTLTISTTGTIHAVVFNKTSLGRILLNDEVEVIGGEVDIRGMENLIFTPKLSPEDKLWEQNPLKFKIEGTVNMVGKVDTEEIKKEIAGVTKSEAEKIMRKYSTIKEVDISIVPPWKTVFPKDPAKIKIVVVDL